MIHKGRFYRCTKEYTDEVNGKKVKFFKEGGYKAPKDDTLVAETNIEVTITPDVADRCFKEEMINNPAHYRGNVECIEAVRDMPFWKGNAIKYLWRAGLKEELGKSDIDKEIEDLEKAKWYINDRIKKLEEQ